MVHILCQSVFSRGTILGAVPRLNSRPAKGVTCVKAGDGTHWEVAEVVGGTDG